MPNTPDVLEALDIAISDCELARHTDAAATLTTLAEAIWAYREALRRHDTEVLADNWHDIVDTFYTALDRLLACAEASNPHQRRRAMPRPDTLVFDKDRNAWILTDYPEAFDVSTIPDYEGTSAALLLSAHNARWSLMTRVAGLIDESEQRKAVPRDFESHPASAAVNIEWALWLWEPINRLGGADQHLVRHGAIGPTAARYYGGGLEITWGAIGGNAAETTTIRGTEGVSLTTTVPPPPALNDADTARVLLDDLVLRRPAPTPQPPAVKVGDRVLGRWGGSDSDRAASVFYVREITAGGHVIASARPDSSDEVAWAVVGVIEVLPPRATEGPF